jgi:hypothetical protein
MRFPLRVAVRSSSAVRVPYVKVRCSISSRISMPLAQTLCPLYLTGRVRTEAKNADDMLRPEHFDFHL